MVAGVAEHPIVHDAASQSPSDPGAIGCAEKQAFTGQHGDTWAATPTDVSVASGSLGSAGCLVRSVRGVGDWTQRPELRQQASGIWAK